MPIIDVRTPAEFVAGHIPGAFNIPILSNEERAEVGTAYKQISKTKAISIGLERIAPKLSGFETQCREICTNGKALVHCWRGGMRSKSFAWFLESAGLSDVYVLEGGYKSYRNKVLEFFVQNEVKPMMLGGHTGSGKTEILHELARRGHQVVDLEAMAHHKGSAFGAIGQEDQPSTEWFENQLHQELMKLDLNAPIWIEDESHNIGQVCLPINFYRKMQASRIIFLEIPASIRAKRLVGEYVGIDAEQLSNAMKKIGKRLGDLRLQNALKALSLGNYEEAAQIALEYYDKSYGRCLENRKSEVLLRLQLNSEDIIENANAVEQAAKELTSGSNKHRKSPVNAV